MQESIFISFLIDCNWYGFSPLKSSSVFANVGHSVGTPVVSEVSQNIETALELVSRALGGKCNWSILSHPDYRRFLYEQPFLDYWKEALHRGGELSLHPHEDIPGVRSRIKETEYMRTVLEDLQETMNRVNLSPNSFRSGYFGRNDELTEVLLDLGLTVDYSAAPGYQEPSVDSDWREAPSNGGFLQLGNAASYGPRNATSTSVFMIPLGWDGKGGSFSKNYLFNEAADLETLKKVWLAIRDRLEIETRPLFVQYLFHLSAMVEPRFIQRVEDFANYLQANGGIFINGSEAARKYVDL